MFSIGAQTRLLNRWRGARGFTFVELLVVLVIIVILAAIAGPMLSKLLKTSRVQQAAGAVIAACYRARTEAMRYRQPCTIFFGDDFSKNPNKPSPGILPPYTQIEIWLTKLDPPEAYSSNFYSDRSSHWNSDGFNSRNFRPYNSGGNVMYTFDTKVKPLTPEPISFPDGVRILGGTYMSSAATRRFTWQSYLPSNARSELKRHAATFSPNGASASVFSSSAGGGNYDQHNFRRVLIFDMATGEHLIVETAEWKSTTRPRIPTGPNGPLRLTHMGKRTSNNTYYPLTDYRDIPKWADE